MTLQFCLKLFALKLANNLPIVNHAITHLVEVIANNILDCKSSCQIAHFEG